VSVVADTSGGDATRLELSTQSGALQLSGSGQWAASRLRFQGQASAEAGSEAVLGSLLNIIGRRQGALSLISIG
jgi:general secretion pathway protein N